MRSSYLKGGPAAVTWMWCDCRKSDADQDAVICKLCSGPVPMTTQTRPDAGVENEKTLIHALFSHTRVFLCSNGVKRRQVMCFG